MTESAEWRAPKSVTFFVYVRKMSDLVQIWQEQQRQQHYVQFNRFVVHEFVVIKSKRCKWYRSTGATKLQWLGTRKRTSIQNTVTGWKGQRMLWNLTSSSGNVGISGGKTFRLPLRVSLNLLKPISKTYLKAGGGTLCTLHVSTAVCPRSKE